MYQSAPSGPATIPNGALPSGSSNALVAPSTAIRPIRSSPLRVNHSAPSRPAAMIEGWLPADRGRDLTGRDHLGDLPAVHERRPQRPVRPRRQRVRAAIPSPPSRRDCIAGELVEPGGEDDRLQRFGVGSRRLVRTSEPPHVARNAKPCGNSSPRTRIVPASSGSSSGSMSHAGASHVASVGEDVAIARQVVGDAELEPAPALPVADGPQPGRAAAFRDGSRLCLGQVLDLELEEKTHRGSVAPVTYFPHSTVGLLDLRPSNPSLARRRLWRRLR